MTGSTQSPPDHPQRPEHVMDIANAGLDGMRSVMTHETTTAELFSAGLTLMARFVHVLTANGVDERMLKESVVRALFPGPMAPGSRLVN